MAAPSTPPPKHIIQSTMAPKLPSIPFANIPFTNMPADDPFQVITTGAPTFMARLATTPAANTTPPVPAVNTTLPVPVPVVNTTLPVPVQVVNTTLPVLVPVVNITLPVLVPVVNITLPATAPVVNITPAVPTVSTLTSHALPESLPTRVQLFTSKEVDSGIIHAETPSAAPTVSTLSGGASVSSNGVDTPESSVCLAGGRGNITNLLHAGATDEPQLARLLAENFRMTQFLAPRAALVFVGNLPANMSDVELTWALGGMFGGAGVFVSRKVWHKPTALVQFWTFGEAVGVVGDHHVLAGRALRVVPSVHAF